MIAKGIDPESAEEAARRVALRKQENTFLAVTEEFFKRHLSKTRQFKKPKESFDESLFRAGRLARSLRLPAVTCWQSLTALSMPESRIRRITF